MQQMVQTKSEVSNHGFTEKKLVPERPKTFQPPPLSKTKGEHSTDESLSPG